MTPGTTGSSVLSFLLRCWWRHPFLVLAPALALGVVALGVMGVGRSGGPLFEAVMGGPPMSPSGGGLTEGRAWTWMTVGVLFSVWVAVALRPEPGWTHLALTRGMTRMHWAVGQLCALAVAALVFLASMTLLLTISVLTGWRSAPLVGQFGWDLVLWAVGLISIAWFQMAIGVVTGTAWTGMGLAVLALGVACFGGSAAPYTPDAQWIIAVHSLRGALNVAWGAVYLSLWGGACGAVSLWAGARPSR